MNDTDTSERAWPRTALGWYVVGVLSVACVLSFIDRTILSLLVGPTTRDLGVSDTQLSLLQGFAFALFYTLLGIPIAQLADRRNRRNIIAAGIAFWSIATAATSVFIAIYYLLVQREDQAATRLASPEAASPVRTRRVVLLTPEGASGVAEALRSIEGVRLQSWERTDDAAAAFSDAQVKALRDAVASIDAERVLVIVTGEGFEVVPYREA